MDILDIPKPVRQAMPYCVRIKPGEIQILGREYGVLIQIEGGTSSGKLIPKRMPTPKMLERWAYRTDRDHGNQFDQESRTGSFWFYNDAGRPLGEYARALRNFGLWLQRTCTVSGYSDIQQWYGKDGQAKLIF